MFRAIRKWFGDRVADSAPTHRPLPPEPEPAEIAVPEVTVAALQQTLRAEAVPPLLLDVREPWEWRQVHIPSARHIPMNEVPVRLAELPPDQEIVVICAHGSRSLGVAGYLLENGYRASSLGGGITQWVRAGGEYGRAPEAR